MSRIQIKKLVQKGNLLSGTVVFNIEVIQSHVTEMSPNFVINGVVEVQFRLTFSQYGSADNYKCYNLVFIRVNNMSFEDDLTYVVNFTSRQLEIKNKSFTSDDGTWHLIYETIGRQFSFDMNVAMEVLASPSSFATLHEDTELTDFELRAEDGSVHVHRALLAAASPVLARLMAGTWREATEGRVDVPCTLTTLRHFKDYLYLQKLPEAGLEQQQLLLLASCYMIPELEQMCVNKLMSTLSAANACDLIEFACNQKLHRLLLALLGPKSAIYTRFNVVIVSCQCHRQMSQIFVFR